MKERSGERSAACATCGKTFARSDTLLRHQKSHHTTEDRGPVHRVTNGTFRACSACAGARSRCSGGTPCGRCKLRQIDCVYPTKRRKGSSPNDSNSQGPGESPKQQIMGQFNEIVFASNTHGQNQYPPDANMSSMKTPAVPALPHHNSFSNQPQFQHHFEATNPDLSSNVENSLEMPVHSVSNPNISHGQFGDGSMAAPYPPDFNEAPASYGYGPMDDSLNWIPLSVYPQPYDTDLDQSFAYMMTPLPSSGLANDFNSTSSMDGTSTVFPPQTSANHANEQYNKNQGLPSSLLGVDQSPASSTSDGAFGTRSIHSSSSTGDQKRKRRKSSFVPDLFNRPRNHKTTFAFPSLPDNMNPISSADDVGTRCSQFNYDEIFTAFQRLCVETILSSSFESASFPDIRSLNACIDLYFAKLQPTFPLIHQSTFGSSSHWIVVLAVAAIGSTFTKAPYALDLREAFQEFLRRAIHQSADGTPDFSLDVSLAQARILNLVGLVQSDCEQLRTLAPRYHADLSRWCLESGILQLPASDDLIDTKNHNLPNGQETQIWETWVRVESLRRIGYFTWLLDSSLAFIANARPLCNMDDARTPLPCPEAVWNASSPEVWAVQRKRYSETPTLCAALENLYDKKAVDTNLSETSQTLIIHALFQRTWEVGTHIKQPLSEWTPTGKARGFLNTPTKDNFWLPLYPLYANWRNSACDCLDVLHWHATSLVAKASGVEHGLMLQLHLARIVLLTPFQEIQDLLFSLIERVGDGPKASFYVHDGSYQPRNMAKLTQIRKITWRWLREDQHKARLAIIHAGSVFWYVRRYSSSSLYEPIAVYLAAIVLFTYGSHKTAALDRDGGSSAAASTTTSKPVGGPSGPEGEDGHIQPSRVERKVRSRGNIMTLDLPTMSSPDVPPKPERSDSYRVLTPMENDAIEESESESETSSDQPEFIYLDRPNDDEMVQHFVRSGHNMSGHMSNVGDICKTPQRVLLEGAKLLRTRLSCWGVSREYYDILTRLSELRKIT